MGGLKLKGGDVITKDGLKSKKEIKKEKRLKKEAAAAVAAAAAAVQEDDEGVLVDPGTGEKKIDPKAIDPITGKTYEEIFDLEMKRAAEHRQRGSTPWGSSFRAPPEVLHGYTKKVKGKTATERLDLRSASKADKFCK